MQTIRLTRPVVLRLTIGVAEQLKRLGYLDVFSLPTEPEQFSRLIAEPQTLAAVLWEMCDRAAMTSEQFLEWFSTSEPERLAEACFAEIVDFFREPMRPIVAALIESAKSADDAACRLMLQAIRSSPPSVVSVNEPSHGNESGSLQVSLDSIHETSVIENSTRWQSGVNDPSGVAQVA